MNKYGIKIDESKRSKIEELIEKANSRAKVRLGSFEDLMNAIQVIMKKFEISKKALEGCRFCINASPEDFPNAYVSKGMPASTHYYVQVHAGNWYLYDVCRERCEVNRTVVMVLTEDAKAALIKKYYKF